MDKNPKRLIVDCHAHILPRLDHGSRSIDESVTQLGLAASAGIDVVVATSHFYPQETTLEKFLPAREISFTNLCKANVSNAPRIILGAEVLFCEYLSKMEGLEFLCIGENGPLLLEMPFGKWRDEWFEEIFRIRQKLNGRVILAHVDRYDRRYIDFLLDEGFYAQLNVSSLDKLFVSGAYKKWIKGGKIFALGSDLHGTSAGYEPFLRVKEKLGSDFDSIMDRTRTLLDI